MTIKFLSYCHYDDNLFIDLKRDERDKQTDRKPSFSKNPVFFIGYQNVPVSNLSERYSTCFRTELSSFRPFSTAFME